MHSPYTCYVMPSWTLPMARQPAPHFIRHGAAAPTFAHALADRGQQLRVLAEQLYGANDTLSSVCKVLKKAQVCRCAHK